jgi:hypothetical protein
MIPTLNFDGMNTLKIFLSIVITICHLFGLFFTLAVVVVLFIVGIDPDRVLHLNYDVLIVGGIISAIGFYGNKYLDDL